MSKEKVERNRLVARLYNQGKTDIEILAGLLEKGFNDYQEVKSVAMQISRLRKTGKVPQERPGSKEKSKIIKKQPSKIISKEKIKTEKKQKIKKGIGKEYLPVTYYIPEKIKWQIKALAAQKRQQVSELIRNILTDYLQNL